MDYEKKDCIDYKKEIMKLIEEVKDPYILKRVYKLLEYLYIKEMAGD